MCLFPVAVRNFQENSQGDAAFQEIRSQVLSTGLKNMPWTREPGAADVAVSSLCRSCHRDDPDPAEHPAAVMAWSQELRSGLRNDPDAEMPVFDSSARHATIGQIGCASCHDPHRQDAEGEVEGTGKFLRLSAQKDFLCADCHAQQSLFLYQYFHSARSRRRQ
jgi:predicted CXXCH cytochrome family protein